MADVKIELKPGSGAYIGRRVRITVLAIAPDGAVRISVQAPNRDAISRDDISLEEHLERQIARESWRGDGREARA